jgi:penicillin-binding protein 2
VRKREHAWFIAFAPVDDPKIAISVLIENGGFGGSTAGPIARKVLDTYLLADAAAEPKKNSAALGSATNLH